MNCLMNCMFAGFVAMKNLLEDLESRLVMNEGDIALKGAGSRNIYAIDRHTDSAGYLMCRD